MPLAHLPLEDEIPTVEKWYQLVTLNPSPSNSPSKNKSLEHSSSSISNGYPGEKHVSSSPHRSPSVLLEISLCSSEVLNESEEHAFLSFGEEAGGATDEDDGYELVGERKQEGMEDHPEDPAFEHSNSSQRNRKRSSSSSNRHLLVDDKLKIQKQKEKEKIERDGPPVLPGIIDYICVVGVNEMGDAEDLYTSQVKKGWLQVERDSCLLEQFPPNNEVHSKQGRYVNLSNLLKLKLYKFLVAYNELAHACFQKK